jgi:hypothetical protein
MKQVENKQREQVETDLGEVRTKRVNAEEEIRGQPLLINVMSSPRLTDTDVHLGGVEATTATSRSSAPGRRLRLCFQVIRSARWCGSAALSGKFPEAL